jgi:hypothetical protein
MRGSVAFAIALRLFVKIRCKSFPVSYRHARALTCHGQVFLLMLKLESDETEDSIDRPVYIRDPGVRCYTEIIKLGAMLSLCATGMKPGELSTSCSTS